MKFIPKDTISLKMAKNAMLRHFEMNTVLETQGKDFSNRKRLIFQKNLAGASPSSKNKRVKPTNWLKKKKKFGNFKVWSP